MSGHPSLQALMRELPRPTLSVLMGYCGEEPAEPEECAACAAYMEAVRRDNPKGIKQ